MNRQEVATSTIQAVKQVGQYGRHFQSHEIREKLQFDEASDEGHYLHNVIGRLKKQGIVEVVGDKTRKRNQYLRVVDEPALRLKLDRPTSRNGRVARSTSSVVGTDKAATAPRRVLYLEDRVARLEEVVQGIDAKTIADIKERIDAVDQKVSELVDLWS